MRFDLAVVGAGPAGLAAASAATSCGMTVVVVDERRATGGSVSGFITGFSAKEPEASFYLPALGVDDAVTDRMSKLTQDTGDAVILLDSFVWGLFDGWTLAVSRSGRGTERVESDQVVLATGEFVVRPPFRGHELDCVETPAGFVHALSSGLVPRTAKVVIIGDDDLAHRIATHVAGLNIESIVLLTERQHRSRFRNYVMSSPVVARGAQRVKELVFRSAGQDVLLPADWVVVTGPRSAASELALLVGCDHHFAGYSAGYRPDHAHDGSTSVPGIYVAGAVAGMDDVDSAIQSGAIAGTAAAVRAGYSPPGILERLATNNMRREPMIPGLIPQVLRAIEPQSLAPACRCTGASYAAVAESIRNGARSLDDVKRQTAAGMGSCQGRGCQRSIIALLAAVGNVDPALTKPLRARPPIRPLPVTAMLDPGASI